MIGSMPSRDRFRCHFAPSEFEPATVVPDKDLDKYDEYLPESLLAKWRTRKDPLEAVWDSMLVPLLKERPALTPTTLLEMLQDKYPGQYSKSLRRTMQRRVREWKLQSGAEQEVMFRQWHQPGLRGLLDFTKLKGVVVTIAGKLLVHMLYNFRLEWSHWS